MDTQVTLRLGILIMSAGLLLLMSEFIVSKKKSQIKHKKLDKQLLTYLKLAQRKQLGAFFLFFGFAIIMFSIISR